MDVKATFATRLRRLRESRDLSQTDLANEIGISRGSVSFYEKGERAADLETLFKLSKFFNVSSDYLLGIKDENILRSYFDELNGKNIEINSYALDLYSKINSLFFDIHVYYYNKFGLENDGESDPLVPHITKLIYNQVSELIDVYIDFIEGLSHRLESDAIKRFLYNANASRAYSDEILLETLRLLDVIGP